MQHLYDKYAIQSLIISTICDVEKFPNKGTPFVLNLLSNSIFKPLHFEKLYTLTQNILFTDFVARKVHLLDFPTETVFDDVVAHVLKVIQNDAVNKYKVLICSFDYFAFFLFEMTNSKITN
jgi:hypothetical protein